MAYSSNDRPTVWPALAFHLLLISGIAVLVYIFYLPWFVQGGFMSGVLLVYGHEVVGVLGQYYLIMTLVSYYQKPWVLVIGLLMYYLLTYSYYFWTALLVYKYTGLDDFSGVASHFIQHREQFWQQLLTYETLFRLVRFPILLTLFPLGIRAGVELYQRQVNQLRLQQQLTELELNFLKSQVNPHFLFNTLNSIYSLTVDESPQAAAITLRLAELMRYALYETTGPFVPLTKEITFIRNYVSLEQVRASKRVQIELDIQEQNAETLVIAPFILITFVENAFKHGVHSSRQQSKVQITIHVLNQVLQLSVRNSKRSVANKSGKKTGLGLANVRKRLQLLYPNQHWLQIDEQPTDFTVVLTLHLQTQAATTSAPTLPYVPLQTSAK